MCGLVGAAGVFTENDRKALRQLLIFDSVRGDDSTGLALVRRQEKGAFDLVKSLHDPFNLFNSWDVFDHKGVVKENIYKAYIGHNRAATKGKVTEDNAHPFHQGKIVGAHNGTLTTVRHLDDGYKFDVDSEAIMHNLNISSPQETIPKVQGAYALTWYNQVEDKLYFIRNSQRPLYYTRRTDRDVIFWASEEWMLRVALGRCGIQCSEVKSFTVDRLYSIDLGVKYFRDVEIVDEGELKGYVHPTSAKVYYPQYQGTGNASSWPKTNDTNDGMLPKSELEKLIGQEVEFYVECEEKTNNGMPYLFARPITMEPYEIRIFGEHHKDYELWKNTFATFKGKIKRAASHYIKGRAEKYVVLDLRTIVQVIGEPDKGKGEVVPLKDHIPFNVKGWNGVPLTYDQWKKATNKGCAWCSASAEPDDDILWISHDEFLCEEHKDNPNLAQYCAHLLQAN